MHVISSCPNISARYYLPLRHNAIAEAIYTMLHKKMIQIQKYIVTKVSLFIMKDVKSIGETLQ